MASKKIPTSELVEIDTVRVDPSLPQEQRIASFAEQIKNPYHYLVGGIQVIARFTSDGPSLEECIYGALA